MRDIKKIVQILFKLQFTALKISGVFFAFFCKFLHSEYKSISFFVQLGRDFVGILAFFQMYTPEQQDSNFHWQLT